MVEVSIRVWRPSTQDFIDLWVSRDDDEAAFMEAWERSRMPQMLVHIFTDGACLPRPWARGARAGWGFVAFSWQLGKPLWRAFGPAPGTSVLQTAPSAEWHGILQAASMADPASFLLPVAVDCLQVVRAVDEGMLHRGRKFDGVLKNINEIETSKGFQVTVQKVTAHVTIHEGMAWSDQMIVKANDLADEVAKAGAAVHRSPGEAHVQLAENEWDAWVTAARLVASMLECWPTVAARETRLQLIRPRPRQAPQRALPAEQHKFITAGRHRICERCLFRVKSAGGELKALWRPCPGSAQVIGNILQNNEYFYKPHVLTLFASGGRPGLICKCCGCHTSSMQQNLGCSCLANATKKGKQCLARFIKGLHPHQREGRRRLDACWEINEQGGLS